MCQCVCTPCPGTCETLRPASNCAQIHPNVFCEAGATSLPSGGRTRTRMIQKQHRLQRCGAQWSKTDSRASNCIHHRCARSAASTKTGLRLRLWQKVPVAPGRRVLRSGRTRALVLPGSSGISRILNDWTVFAELVHPRTLAQL